MRLPGIGVLFLVPMLVAVALGRPDVKERILTFDERYLDNLIWNAAHPLRAPSLPAVPGPAASAYDWVPKARFFPIAHALGSSDTGSMNSIGAFDRSYAAGFRLFEVDLSLTPDNQLICRHGDSDQDSFTSADYAQERQGKPGCTFPDIVAAARAHPDAHFILDVKNRFDDAYRLIRGEIGTPALGRSFIPQLYEFSELPQFRADSFFAGPIFTSYKSRLNTREVMHYARAYDVRVVTLADWRINRLWPGDPLLRSAIVLGHPMDTQAGARLWRSWGIRGIYTFVLSPAAAPSLYRDARR